MVGEENSRKVLVDNQGIAYAMCSCCFSRASNWRI